MKALRNWWLNWRHRNCHIQHPVNGMSRCMDHPWVEWYVDMPVSKELGEKIGHPLAVTE